MVFVYPILAILVVVLKCCSTLEYFDKVKNQKIKINDKNIFGKWSFKEGKHFFSSVKNSNKWFEVMDGNIIFKQTFVRFDGINNDVILIKIEEDLTKSYLKLTDDKLYHAGETWENPPKNGMWVIKPQRLNNNGECQVLKSVSAFKYNSVSSKIRQLYSTLPKIKILLIY